MSPITPKNRRYAVTSEIEEEAQWDQDALEDESELVEKKNYKVKAGQHYTGKMRKEGAKKKTFVPHGKGTMTFDDGCVTEGVWKNGQILEGTQIFTNGDRYQG